MNKKIILCLSLLFPVSFYGAKKHNHLHGAEKHNLLDIGSLLKMSNNVHEISKNLKAVTENAEPIAKDLIKQINAIDKTSKLAMKLFDKKSSNWEKLIRKININLDKNSLIWSKIVEKFGEKFLENGKNTATEILKEFNPALNRVEKIADRVEKITDKTNEISTKLDSISARFDPGKLLCSGFLLFVAYKLLFDQSLQKEDRETKYRILCGMLGAGTGALGIAIGTNKIGLNYKFGS